MEPQFFSFTATELRLAVRNCYSEELSKNYINIFLPYFLKHRNIFEDNLNLKLKLK